MIQIGRHFHMYSKMMAYFRNEALMSNFFLKSLIVLTLTQQIYFPQKHSYFHLGLLFMYVIFIDVLDEEKRQVDKEWPFMGAILTAVMASFVEKWMHLNLELVYFAGIAAAAVFAAKLLLDLIQILRNPDLHGLVAKRNQKMLKAPGFVIGLLYALEVVLGVSLGYIVYLTLRTFI